MKGLRAYGVRPTATDIMVRVDVRGGNGAQISSLAPDFRAPLLPQLRPVHWQAVLLQDGPLSVGFEVYEDFLVYQSGVYSHGWGVGIGAPLPLRHVWLRQKKRRGPKMGWTADWAEGALPY